jgi:hypothetical protein
MYLTINNNLLQVNNKKVFCYFEQNAIINLKRFAKNKFFNGKLNILYND